jgi:putative two-component system response regulator
VDYITKPVNPPIVLARVETTQLTLKAQPTFCKTRTLPGGRGAAPHRELAAIQDVTILAMASLAETRDNDTGNHIRRTQHYVKALAEHLKRTPALSPP